MAVTDDGIVLPQSTGAVETPKEPVTVQQTADNTSTGAVEFSAEPVVAKFGPSGQKPTGTVETPGPVTVENVSVKVVNAPAKSNARGGSTAETKSGD